MPLDPYRRLAQAVWTHTAGGKEVGTLLGVRRQTLRRWELGTTPLRTSTWAITAKKNGVSLHALGAVLAAPLPFRKEALAPTARAVRANFVGPILKLIRRDRPLKEVQKICGLGTWSTYHHWETGRRDIPFFQFLKAIDLLSSRLSAVCETLGFEADLETYGLLAPVPKFSENFFGLPWTPTVFLALQTTEYLSRRSHSTTWLANKLGLAADQVEKSLRTLETLRMVNFNGRNYTHRKGQFYTPPTLSPEKLRALNEYWFGRSLDLTRFAGLHKIDAHAMSYELLEKVNAWIAELRERIRREVKKCEPETLVHLHWQVADLLNPDLDKYTHRRGSRYY